MNLGPVLRNRRVLGGMLAAVVVAGVWFTVPRLMRAMDFFALRRVEVTGARYLSAADVVAAMGLAEGASIADPLGHWEAEVAAMPGVREVVISRRLPGTLRVRIVEAEPVALAQRGGRLTLVDARGDALPFDPTRFPPDLPVVEGNGVAGVVALVKAVDPRFFNELESGTRVRNHVVLVAGSRRLLLRTDASVEEVQNMAAVANDLATTGRAWRELDGRFAGQVLVRGMGG